MTSAELLQQQLATSKRRKPKGVKQDLQAGATYHTELRRIVREVRKDIDTHVMSAVKSTSFEYIADGVSTHVVMDSYVDVIAGALKLVRERWSSPQFNALATRITRKFVTTANNSNAERTKRDLGIDVFVDNSELRDYVQASIYDNVRLIESIPAQYLTQVDSIVLSGVRSGSRPNTIAKQLQRQFGVTERRAKLIARDQSNKINSNLSKMRMTNAGFEYFRWETSHDERVRDRHKHVSERVTAYGEGVFRFDNPPIVDQNAPQLPGEPIQCRCIAIPISGEEVAENQRKGLTNPSVKR
ncbi:MAG: hypothetical protein Tp118SUR00d2C21406351_49 [Prokaryotic dsDNA virus sp.]|nr:MAG: hypothetical protein Tp118SUR00d2C21406351_49 [Prokaryotic dsDNA virus sp.]|tara:strand:- start:2620 stop:3516 length:897 start_codon:yes stop_codon:yes gene_type:complete